MLLCCVKCNIAVILCGDELRRESLYWADSTQMFVKSNNLLNKTNIKTEQLRIERLLLGDAIKMNTIDVVSPG